MLCRCSGAIVYAPWISNALLECYVIAGKLTVNGEELEQGDYSNVPAGHDGFFTTETSMEALVIMHGIVIRAKEVFDEIRERSLSVKNASALLALPWIDHLRRHARVEHVNWICDLIDSKPDEAVSELCISAARSLKSERLSGCARQVLDGHPNVSLRITATLYLASKDELDSIQWQTQLQKMAERPDELLRVLRAFYSAGSNEELAGSVSQRINSGHYGYNMPFYEMILRMAAR